MEGKRIEVLLLIQ